MHIIYPYNEILPKKKAHDVFIFQECAAFAQANWKTTLLIGKGSDTLQLPNHYKTSPSKHFSIKPLSIVRKNNPFDISWNWPFFALCQKEIVRMHPDAVLLSVQKQGDYHLHRKISGVRYVYEVHELAYYPNQTLIDATQIHKERTMLSLADFVVVTTQALKQILQTPPYSLTNPIVHIPLAVQAEALPSPIFKKNPLKLAYVGQLYEGQGVETLLMALSKVKEVHLKVIGGKHSEIERLSKIAQELDIRENVTLIPFVPPNEIPLQIQDIDGFVAPFHPSGRMPYVAHTKLVEYVEWGRPVIAPDLPIAHEYFPQKKGALFFEAGNPASLAEAICHLQQEPLRRQLQNEITSLSGRFSWKARIQQYQELLSKKFGIVD